MAWATGCDLVISDQHAGLVKALTRCFAGRRTNAAGSTSPATCWRWFPSPTRDMVAAVFRTIFAQPDATAVHTAWDEVRDQLKAFPKIGPLMDDAKAEVLAFTAFPKAHWVKIWSTTPSSG